MYRRVRRGEREALEILPEEVWTIVLEFLKSGRDLHNASKTCKVWKKCLKKYQVTWKLFPIFPSLYSFLPKSTILTARLVCTSWKETVDKYLQTRQAFMRRSTVLGHPTNWLRLLTADFPQTREKLSIERNRFGIGEDNQVLEIFQQHFSQYRSNPFPSRSIHVHLTKIASEPLSFFQKFGCHIWYLSLSIDQSHVGLRFGKQEKPGTPANVTKFLWAVLRNTPHLKSLKLKVVTDSRNFNQVDLEDQKLQQELNLFLNKTNPPLLSKLKNLELSLCMAYEQVQSKLQSTFANQLTAYSQLDTTNHLRCAKFFVSSFESLNQLSCQLGWPRGYLSQIKNLKQLNCSKLESLTFEIRQKEARVHRCPSLLFAIAEQFGNSLKHFAVYWEHLEYNLPENLNLPVLETISIEVFEVVFPSEISFNFLNSLKTLKKLKLCFSQNAYSKTAYKQKDINEIIQLFNGSFSIGGRPTIGRLGSFGCYLDSYDKFCERNAISIPRIYKCNIWNILPDLDLIEVGIVMRYTEAFRRGADAHSLHGKIRKYTRKDLLRNKSVVNSE